MREYLIKRKFYLARILMSEAPPPERPCSVCGTLADWRCEDCYARPLYCTSCCSNSHSTTPFHHVEHWVGDHFARSALLHTGLVLHFGHHGKPCPCYQNSSDTGDPLSEPAFGLPEAPAGLFDNDNDNDDTIPFSHMELDDDGSLLDSEVPTVATYGSNVLVVVHSNGVHHLPVHWCRCSGHVPDDIQALDLQFFPASYKQIRTLFTFQGLNSFLAENQECKTSAWHYYQKIRRLTSGSYPHTVPV